jgi:plastocyanin
MRAPGIPRPVAAAVLLAALLLTAAVAGGGAAPAEEGAVIDIRDFAVEPHEVAISTGMQVRWVNRDTAVHSIIMEGGLPGSSGLLEAGREHTAGFRGPGRVTYRCGVHPTMLGVILVR